MWRSIQGLRGGDGWLRWNESDRAVGGKTAIDHHAQLMVVRGTHMLQHADRNEGIALAAISRKSPSMYSTRAGPALS